MNSLPQEVRPVYEGLLRVGFLKDRLNCDVLVPGSDHRADLLAFSDRPLDSRTAAIAVVIGTQFSEPDISALRPLGAPVVFACQPNWYQVWKQTGDRARFHCPLTPSEVPGFFHEHAKELEPGAIYRAKTWARIDDGYQLDFVDAGLLPVVEAAAGEKLRLLVERVVASTRKHLGWSTVSESNGQWLLKATFWLLAAKILQDKQVPGFVRLALTDLDTVFERLANHYRGGAPKPVPVGGRDRREALAAAAREIQSFGHCGLVSTEALAHLYESALIDRATRQRLGTHSTPPWLVDYVIGRLRPWIERDIPMNDRQVFEPACGHAAFLISAMRLLGELLPPEQREQRHSYLRRRLHGMERDSFAIEIARLSLTLADVPNPNGWALTEADMFPGDRLERAVREATIVLANPPFEDFEAGTRSPDWLHNKAAETFRRVVGNIRPGGVFGFVLPQTLLHSQQARSLREALLRSFEISEISLFADKAFRYGEPESAVIIGRRHPGNAPRPFALRYQRVREGQVAEFSRTFAPSGKTTVTYDRLLAAEDASLLVPELDDLWQSLAGMKRMAEFAVIGQGLIHRSMSDPVRPRGSITESRTETDGLLQGFSTWRESQTTHELPSTTWLSLLPATIRRPVSGTTVGIAQVLLNYARVSREAWRLKALIDDKGHPVTSRFIVVRPKLPRASLLVVWGLCNSPVVNAYAYCRSSKRDILAGDMREMPVPDLATTDLGPLERAVSDYLAAARAMPSPKPSPIVGSTRKRKPADQMALFGDEPAVSTSDADSERLKFLHWRVDAEVLRLYDLPGRFERRLLDLFAGVRRRGVPFVQTEYFPKGYTDLDRLSDLLAITADWENTNRRRGELLDLEDEGRLTPAQVAELANLQRLADALLGLMEPWKPDTVDCAVERARQRSEWKE